MNKLKDIKKLVPPVLDGGDILFIVPPFVTREYSTLGIHILQSVAQEIGFKTDALYLNMLFASIIGEEIYDGIRDFTYNSLRWMRLGERLFARSAYGLPPLGKEPESGADEELCITGGMAQQVRVVYKSIDIDRDRLLKVEEICTSFIDEIVQVITSFNYKIIGCTSMLDQTNCSLAILNGIKKTCPDIITLIGGKNCDGEMAQGIASLTESIDYIFTGESELSFKAFLEDYSGGKLPSHRIISSKPLTELDVLPVPCYESYFKQLQQFFGDNTPEKKIIIYETSRGCWWGQKKRCAFCGNNDEQTIGYRHKSAIKVKQDLEHIIDNYPVTGILMADNIMPNSYYKTLYPWISKKKEFPAIWYQENPNLTLKDLLSQEKAHIKSILAGIESLSTGILKLINKRVSAGHNILLLRNARAVGIEVLWYMLWGIPGDKISFYKETIRLLPLIRHLQPPLEFVHLLLVRFSSYVENPQSHQINNLRPSDIYKQIYPDWTNIDKLAYFYMGDYPCEAHEHPEIMQELTNEIDVWKRSWRNSNLSMIAIDNYYMVYDSRRINGENKNYILEASQVREIMAYCIYNESENQKWAMEQKLGVVVDGWYVPLVTASPELLLTFEENNNHLDD